MSNKNTLMLFVKLLPVYFIVVLILGYAGYSSFQEYVKKSEINSFFNSIGYAKESQSSGASGIPIQIIIPESNIKVQVKPGNYNYSTNQWEITSNNAHYMAPLAPKDMRNGNTIIYAHNTKNLFGDTSKLKKGDVAYVRTSTNAIFVYRYIAEEKVAPTDVSVLQSSSEGKLTLLTCEGYFDQVRKLMYFKFEKVI